MRINYFVVTDAGRVSRIVNNVGALSRVSKCLRRNEPAAYAIQEAEDTASRWAPAWGRILRML